MLTLKKEMKEIKSAKELNEVMTEQLKELKKNPEILEQIFSLQAIIRFGKFSFGNYCLTKFQMKTAEIIKGFRQWEKLERHVKKGERALYIYAPTFTSKKTLEALKEEIAKETNENRKTSLEKKLKYLERAVRFSLVPVFDVSQTQGKPLADANETTGAKFIESEKGPFLTGALLEKIKEFLKAVNIPVEYATHYKLSGTLQLNRTTKDYKIILTEGVNPAGSLATLFHEIGHYKFNHLGKEIEDKIKEGEAEIFAHLVSKYFGVNTDKATGAYLASYLDELKDEEIFENFQNVIEIAVEFVRELEDWKATNKAVLKTLERIK